MRKTGFSILELIICLTIIFLIIASSSSIFMRKLKKTSETLNPKKDFLTFSCDNSENKTSFDFDTSNLQHEFYAIKIVGGGAGGGYAENIKGGNSGEAKLIFYPSLPSADEKGNKIKYHVELGKGGNKGQNGGQTTLYKITTKENGAEEIEILEYALGGISNNEVADIDENGKYKNKGEMPTLILEAKKCGKGGNYNEKGETGWVAIEW